MALIITAGMTNEVLDWAVAKAEGYKIDTIIGQSFLRQRRKGSYNYTECWNKAGPIIHREKIKVWHTGDEQAPWRAAYSHAMQRGDYRAYFERSGPDPLVCALRAYVALKLGDEVEVPDDLLQLVVA